MNVKRSPTPTSDKKREELISQGGRSATKPAQSDRTEAIVNLRIPTDMLAQVDKAVKRRRLPTPRHRWLLEAIDEKLERESAFEEIRMAEDELLAVREGRSRTYPLEEVMRAHGNLER
jgi:hypothetical protein